MSSLSSFGLCLVIFARAAAGLRSNDELQMFAIKGDRMVLPCGLPNIQTCSSVNWIMNDNAGGITEKVKLGRVTNPEADRHQVLKDCSLEITPLVLDDARTYTCESGNLNSSVSLRILELTENSDVQEGTMELQCYLNTFKGLSPCNKDTGICIRWSAEDDTPIEGKRFEFENPSTCFSKLIITKKLTDHLRTWRCHLTQNNEVKATAAYTTTVRDGLEEVFAAAGESVSFTCGNTSSLSLGGSIRWAVMKTPHTYKSPASNQTQDLDLDRDSSLVISKLSPSHAGDYQCSESTGQKRVLNRIRLHTLDVTEKSGPGDKNVTFTCVLTCAEECEDDFNLTWSGANQEGRQSGLMSVNNTVMKELILPVWPTSSDEITCSVYREGALTVSKKWRPVNSLQTLAWLGLPLGLLVTVGGLYLYMKKHNWNTAKERSDIGMTHVYDVIQDEEPENQTRFEREADTKIDGFYDLLQAVN